MEGLTHAMVKELRDAFLVCDIDGDGEIDITDLSKTFKAFGFDRTEEEIKTLLRNTDTDNNGTITFPEFVVIVVKSLGRIESSRKNFVKAFNVFDSRNEGFASKSDLQRINASFGKIITDSEAQKFLELVDVNKDQKVDLEEFISLLTAGIHKRN